MRRSKGEGPSKLDALLANFGPPPVYALAHLRLPCLADYGVEEAVKVEGLSKADITKQLEALVKKGESMPRSAESEGKL